MTNTMDLIVAKIIIKARLKSRKIANKIKISGGDIDRYFVCSEFDFHRTRLNRFTNSHILTLIQLNELCQTLGITFNKLLTFFRSAKLPADKM